MIQNDLRITSNNLYIQLLDVCENMWKKYSKIIFLNLNKEELDVSSNYGLCNFNFIRERERETGTNKTA